MYVSLIVQKLDKKVQFVPSVKVITPPPLLNYGPAGIDYEY